MAYVYNAFLLAGTVWLVGWHNWSPWWFLLTIGLMAFYRKDTDE